ncbi:MAG: hypothetical protein LBH42_00565 [Treponema sp.]|jgi:hypothetical protein|nr:hypothetical protein [Treponema sp.]
MRRIYLIKIILVFVPFIFSLCSCLGVNVDIVINQNGSGTVALEYSIARTLDFIGRLDGNERWNTIPVGRADFERTIDRLPEMKLLSFSSKEDDKNLIITAKLGFDSLLGLLAFFDSGGRRSTFSGDDGLRRITLTLNEGTEQNNPDLNKLLEAISESYSVRMAMSFPSEGSLVITDKYGKSIERISGSEIQARGKKVIFSIPSYEVLSSANGINVEFSW